MIDMGDMSAYTRTHGFPVKSITKGGVTLTDSYYGPWSAILNFDDMRPGDPCPDDASLSLVNIAIRRGEHTSKGYVELTYQPAEGAGQTGIVDSNVPMWTCRIGTLEKPIETHPDYRTNWNYNLVVKSGAEAGDPTTWWTSNTDLSVDLTFGDDVYKWVKDEVPAGYNMCESGNVKFVKQIPGVESYILPSPVVESTFYYSSYRSAVDALLVVGTKATPDMTFGAAGGEWLVMGCDVSLEGKKWAVRTTYQWADKWNDKLYGE
jgi:hypothetical protein